MCRENLHIRLFRDRAKVEVSYILHNTGPVIDVRAAFPSLGVQTPNEARHESNKIPSHRLSSSWPFALHGGSWGKRGCAPFPCTPNPRRTFLRFAPDDTILLDDSEHLLHNHHDSVASLRLLFTFATECRSPSFRNRCSPSPEYPPESDRWAL